MMIPPKPFYLLRHGETIANAEGISAGGGYDTPLNDNGINQALALSRVVSKLDILPEKILHSSMSRARDTATIVNESLNLTMLEIDELKEHMLGEWEGKPWEDIQDLLHSDVKPEGGESKTDFSLRVRKVFTDILDLHDELLLIVAHGGVFHSFAYLYDHDTGHVENCHLHYFEPTNNNAQFPWHVWHFDINGNEIIKNSARFCGSKLIK